jgi:hypothetical protein
MAGLTAPEKDSSPVPANTSKPDFRSYDEYYRRHGFLPPGYSIEVNGQTYHGGCHRWRAWADSQGYPQDPSPAAPKQHHDIFQRRLDEIYRPWL